MTTLSERPYYYILRDGVPVPVSCEEWGSWFETANRVIERTTLEDGTVISTAFLGLDHAFGLQGEPVLYETLVFGSELDGEMERYITLAEARRGHAEMVQKVKYAQQSKRRRNRRNTKTA